MTISDQKLHHARQAAKARDVYIASRTPANDLADWTEALRASRKVVSRALKASRYLTDVAAALRQDGVHMLVFRHLMAPPMSQDQFALMCPAWRKGTEKPATGRRKKPMPQAEADATARAFHARRSRALTPWVDEARMPRRQELRRLLWSVSPTIANQMVGTLQRGRAASAQESAVLDLLDARGWHRQPGSLLDTRAALPSRHYMHKVRYATATKTPQEVDIALGLGNTEVLAMECKVTNDQTNSVKRINDVLKKATAWEKKWGTFVKTAALLQGVIAANDVERLLDAGVLVFWSHDLAAFSDWLDAEAL